MPLDRLETEEFDWIPLEIQYIVFQYEVADVSLEMTLAGASEV